MKKKGVPINQAVLKWARESHGLEIEDVAAAMKKSVDDIIDWESGQSSPTYVQLETLAYQIYKRPIAVFFFPKPPEEETPGESFRTLPQEQILRLSPRVNYLIRQARALQINLEELYIDEKNFPQYQLKELQFRPEDSALKIAEMVRERLGISLDQQISWKSEDEAFKSWRQAFAEQGIFVFKEAFKLDAISGFCLSDSRFPIIYVNNSKATNRQIFTLFHELCHLLFNTGGVDTRSDDYIKHLDGDNKKIEILCNQFAGAFLVPDDDFDKQSYSKIDEPLIEKFAERYKVSREVILRKFLDRRRITSSRYRQLVNEWSDFISSKKGSGGNYYNNKCAYLGDHYLSLAFGSYYKKKISLAELAGYLGVKVNNVSGIESLFLNKGSTV